MKQIIVSVALILLIEQCLCQTGFPKQFQATLNITGIGSSVPVDGDVQKLLYDFENLRVRFDVQGWPSRKKQAYIIEYKPEGAEADSPASKGYTMFNFNPDYPEYTKNNCWYRTDPINILGPFPKTWIFGTQGTQILPWVPLPSNLINKGEEWIPEVQLNATRYDSPTICDLERSGVGKVPCFSYFETSDRPVKTIYARAAVGSFDQDDHISTFYLSFTHGIPSEAEHLFDLPAQWPSYCGNANNGFNVNPVRGFVVTPDGEDHLTLQLETPPVHALGDEVTVEFKVKSDWYYNATRCAKFNPIVFNRENWDKPFQVDMSFVDYGCCNYIITATGGGYDWQYTSKGFVIYACDGQAGYGCKGKEPCGA